MVGHGPDKARPGLASDAMMSSFLDPNSPERRDAPPLQPLRALKRPLVAPKHPRYRSLYAALTPPLSASGKP